jgi:signal transduction histidine kinase/CheY-like chemotaxis protein
LAKSGLIKRLPGYNSLRQGSLLLQGVGREAGKRFREGLGPVWALRENVVDDALNLGRTIVGLDRQALKNIDKIKKYTAILRSQNLYVTLLKGSGEEFFLPTSNTGLIMVALSQARLTYQIEEIKSFLESFVYSFKAAGREIPRGRLDLVAAMQQFYNGIGKLGWQDRVRLESDYMLAAVRDNLMVGSNLVLSRRFKAIVRMIRNIKTESISEAFKTIVFTAQKLWPGGNPGAMLYREENGKEFLIPMAVALPPEFIKVAEERLDKNLGEYKIPIVPGSSNPYVKAFLRRGTQIEEDVSFDRFTKICGGFIDEGVIDIKARFLHGISFPKAPNANLFAVLKSKGRNIGVLAITRKGYFSKEDREQVDAFLQIAVAKLESILERDERRAYEIKLREAHETLLVAERKAAVGLAAARIHHQVKNILVSASAQAAEIRRLLRRRKTLLDIVNTIRQKGLIVDHLLDEFARIDQKIAELNNKVDSKVGEAEGAARGVLSRAKRRSTERKNVPLKRFFDEMAEEYGRDYREGQIDFYAQSNLGDEDFVYIAEEELTDLFRNLINNAFAAVKRRMRNGDKGIVQFTVIRDKREPVVNFKVVDTGTGIAKDVLSKLFDREGVSEEGFGFGLPTAKSIVDKNDGKIHVESSTEGRDRGTKFVVTFPLVRIEEAEERESVVSAEQEIPIISPQQASGIKIMLVEDDKSIRGFFSRLLMDMGFELHAYQRAEDALNFLKKKDYSPDFSPDLIISDQNLPNLQGHEFLEEIAKLFKAKNMKKPYMAIHSAGRKPDSGLISKTLARLGVEWMEKEVGEQWMDMFRRRVSVVALGGRLPEVLEGFEKPARLWNNPIYRLCSLIGHKLNNSVTTLAFIEMFALHGKVEDLDETRKAFKRLKGEIEGIQNFVELSKTSGFKDLPWEDTLLPAKILEEDKELAKIWGSDSFGLEGRYNFATIAELYMSMLAEPMQRLDKIFKKNIIDRRDIAEVGRVVNEMSVLNNNVQLMRSSDVDIAQRFVDFYDALDFS